MLRNAEDILASYVDSLHSIIYINHFDSKVVDDALSSIAQGAHITEYNTALGALDFRTKAPLTTCTLEQFLRSNREEGYGRNTFLVLKGYSQGTRQSYRNISAQTNR